MRKAFSLTELFITLSIIAIVIAIVAVSYNNLRDEAQDVVQGDVQRSFIRALEAFRSSGGNIEAIIAASLDTTDKGIALLQALQSTADVNIRNATGRVGALVGDNNKVIEPLDEDSPRLVFSGDSLIISKSGEGFVITSETGVQAAAPSNPTMIASAVDTALNNIDAGNLYATSNSYLWDEDESLVEGPSTMGGSTGAVGSGTTASEIIVAFGDYINGTQNPNEMAFNYANYTGGNSTIEVFAYRRDAVPLTTGDATLSVTFDGAAVGSAANAVRNVHGSNIVSSGGNTISGILVALNTTQLKNPTAWTTSAYSLGARVNSTVAGANKGLNSANAARTISAILTPLSPPEIDFTGDGDGDGVIDYGDSVTVKTRPTNGSPIPLAALKAHVLNDGGLTIHGTNTDQIVLTLPSP